MADGGRGEQGATRESTSPDLSSPPKSPDSPFSKPSAMSTVAYPQLPESTNFPSNAGGEKSPSATRAGNSGAKANTAAVAVATSTVQRRPRKKKEEMNSEIVVKKPRKPRGPNKNPRQPRQAKQAESTSTIVLESKPPIIVSPSLRQGKIPDLVAPPPQPQPQFNVPAAAAPSQSRNIEAIHNPQPNPTVIYAPGQPPPPLRTAGGQNYDPIRSATIGSPSSNSYNNQSSTPQQISPVKSGNRASESPSISSLIDPPSGPAQTYPFSRPSPAQPQPPPQLQSPTVQPPTPNPTSLAFPERSTVQYSLAPAPVLIHSRPPTTHENVIIPNSEPTLTPMDLDGESIRPPPNKAPGRKSATGTNTDPSSTAASPKPSRPKDTSLPRLPPGNGLLSNALFGGSPDLSSLEKTAPTVILHVPLNGETNKYVNFARLAEAQYGFNALHPRLAAQRERLARVAAAGAALENAGKASGPNGSGQSADEMSLDASEGEAEAENSNVEMGGMGTDEGTKVPQPRKRKMKEDQYDKEDPFVDDSELAWEEQAAASKDGFFVYSGPLVQEGEKPVVERADGTIKRGRGRTRGSGTGRGRGSGAHATLAASGTLTTSTGTRGQGVVRKPRVTKAARQILEQEKIERERAALLNMKPTGYVAPGLP